MSASKAPHALASRKTGSGEHVCVFLHGFGSTSHIWDNLLTDVPDQWTCFLLDLRGHGRSAWDPLARYGVSDHVEDVLHTLAQLRLKQFVLIGHSLGGLVALAITARHPRLIRGLVLVDVAPKVEPEMLQRAQAHLPDSFVDFSSPDQYRRVLERRYPLAARHLLAALAEQELELCPNGRYRVLLDPRLATVIGLGSDGRFWTQIEAVQCRTLVMRGAASSFLSREAATKVLDLLEAGTLVVVEGAGHTVMLDNAAGFADGLLPFLAGLALARSEA